VLALRNFAQVADEIKEKLVEKGSLLRGDGHPSRQA
jgi:hypothetical protein